MTNESKTDESTTMGFDNFVTGCIGLPVCPYQRDPFKAPEMHAHGCPVRDDAQARSVAKPPKRKRNKYKRGPAFKNSLQAIAAIQADQWVYLNHKVYSPKWAAHWSIAQIGANVTGGRLFSAEEI